MINIISDVIEKYINIEKNEIEVNYKIMKCINIIIHKKKSILKLHTIVYYVFISYKYSCVRLKFQSKVLIVLNARTKNEINVVKFFSLK